MIKRCYTCRSDKKLCEFNKNKCRKDGLNSICKECSRKRSKEYYNDNQSDHKKTVSSNRRRRVADAKLFVLNLVSKSKCTDCGNKDHRTFEFDHIRGIKKNDISSLVGGGYSTKFIQEEINKCEIVCANCHRIRTFTRAKTYRTIDVKISMKEAIEKYPNLFSYDKVKNTFEWIRDMIKPFGIDFKTPSEDELNSLS